ncbi:MAG: homoserine kinase [Firmicutes bacterium]|nr:homoserine kinase [Bacillota bacterium]
MKIEVRIPATTANLGPGFDTLGLALNIFNYLQIETDCSHPSFEFEGEGASFLRGGLDNLTLLAIAKIFEITGREIIPLRIVQRNQIPLAAGLGSSAAAIVGGLVAANVLLGQPLRADELLFLAAEMEGHSDNAAAALFGGLVISKKEEKRIIYSKIQPQNPPKVIAVIPDFSLKTDLSRSVLPSQVPYEDAVFNLGHLAFLIHCFLSGDYSNLHLACQDKLHQKYRQALVPALSEVIDACVQNGGLGAALSGAGPGVVGFAQKNEERIGKAMQEAFRAQGLKSRIMITEINNDGASLITL